MAHAPVRSVCRFLGSLGYNQPFIYYYYCADVHGTVLLVVADGVEELLVIVGRQARVGQSVVLQHMVAKQNLVVEAMAEVVVSSSLQNCSYQQG